MFVFDTSVFIAAHKHDFPLNDNPGTFWDFVEQQGKSGEIRVPEAVLDELGVKLDEVFQWVNGRKDVFLLRTNDALPYLRRVLDSYGIITDLDLEMLDGKADPYVVAHALALGAIVVSNEISRPGATTINNKKIPDICDDLDIRYIRYPRFLWDMSP